MSSGVGSIGSAFLGGLAVAKQGSATRDQYWARAQADDYNAMIKRIKAQSTLDYGKYHAGEVRAVGNLQEEEVRRDSRIKQGEEAATGAQSGTGEMTNADLERQNAVLGELDALNVRYGAVLTSHDIEQQAALDAQDYLNAAKLDTMNAGTNRQYGTAQNRISTLGAMATLLGGSSKAFGSSS